MGVKAPLKSKSNFLCVEHVVWKFLENPQACISFLQPSSVLADLALFSQGRVRWRREGDASGHEDGGREGTVRESALGGRQGLRQRLNIH